MDEQEKQSLGAEGSVSLPASDPAAAEFIERQKKAAEVYELAKESLKAAKGLLRGHNVKVRGQYVLGTDGRTPIPVDDSLLWARWFERASIDRSRMIARTHLPWGTYISTVFLGLDHSFGQGDPVLWETMIFGGHCDDYQRRYHSYEEALHGHHRAVTLARLSDRKFWYVWPWKVAHRRADMWVLHQKWLWKFRWEKQCQPKLKLAKVYVQWRSIKAWNDGIDWIIKHLNKW